VNAPRAGLSVTDSAIIALTVATAAIHFSRAIADAEIRILFTLNGLGYLTLLSVMYLPIPWFVGRRKLARRLMIGYVALTSILWGVWVAMSGEATGLGMIDKLIEIALIGLLWRQLRQA
jgi:hypothetical protein